MYCLCETLDGSVSTQIIIGFRRQLGFKGNFSIHVLLCISVFGFRVRVYFAVFRQEL